MNNVLNLKKHIGVINSYPSGWKMELNLISWNGATPKYDIRSWEPSHEHMSRGVTFHEEELISLYKILKNSFENMKKLTSFLNQKGESENTPDGMIRYEIIHQLGKIAVYPTGWCKELNIVSWNDGSPKFDIRDWNEEHSSMSRGVTLTLDEVKTLFEHIDRAIKDKVCN